MRLLRLLHRKCLPLHLLISAEPYRRALQGGRTPAGELVLEQ